MNNNFKHLLIAILATAGLAAATAQAQVGSVQVTNLNEINVTLKLQLQSPGYNSDNGAVRSYDAPVTQTINTKNLLARLALDKQLQGQYSFGSFPPGTKLGVWEGHVVVVGPDKLLLADVSDIISFSSGTNGILSGTVNNVTSLASPKTSELSLQRLDFNDTFISGGSGLVFFVQGLNLAKKVDSQVNGATGKYVETVNSQMKAAVGEGSSAGTPLVLAGTIKGNGRAVLTYLPPAS
jgi:hypothetical protein